MPDDEKTISVDTYDVPVPELRKAIPVPELASHGLAPKASRKEDINPLQALGLDRLINRQVIGGPDSEDHQDIRFYLSAGLLREWLEVSQRSTTSRVVIKNAGVVVGTYRTDSGHVFQLMTLCGDSPVPEASGIIHPEGQKTAVSTFMDPQPDDAPGRLIKTKRIPGDGSGHDVRMMLSSVVLETSLRCAMRSRCRKAVIHNVGLVVDTYVDMAGNPYIILTVMGRRPASVDPEDEAQKGGSVGGFG